MKLFETYWNDDIKRKRCQETEALEKCFLSVGQYIGNQIPVTIIGNIQNYTYNI